MSYSIAYGNIHPYSQIEGDGIQISTMKQGERTTVLAEKVCI